MDAGLWCARSRRLGQPHRGRAHGGQQPEHRRERHGPHHLRVPAGSTVTFVSPPGNVHVHGATRFFEGLFDIRLEPGESFAYTFTRPGEYFFNDTHSPRPTGKIEVTPP